MSFFRWTSLTKESMSRRSILADAAPNGQPNPIHATAGSWPPTKCRQVGLHRPRLRRPPSQGVSVRPPVPRAPRGTRRELMTQVEAGFPFLPAGCHMELDRVAAAIVLESIKNAVPSRWTERVEVLRQLTAQGSSCTLGRYLKETGLELEDVYTGNRSCLIFVQTLTWRIRQRIQRRLRLGVRVVDCCMSMTCYVSTSIGAFSKARNRRILRNFPRENNA